MLVSVLVTGGPSVTFVCTGHLRNAAKSSTPKQTISAADLFDDIEGECAHSESLSDSVEASGEELGGCACDAKGLEDSGSVICDNVDTGEGLQEHESEANTHTVAGAALEELHELLLLGPVQGTPLLDLLANVSKLAHDVFMVAGKAAKVAQDFFSRLEVVLACKPSRTLGTEEEHPKTEKQTRSELECERDHVLCHTVRRNVLICTIVDPETEHTTTLRGDFEDADKSTTD